MDEVARFVEGLLRIARCGVVTSIALRIRAVRAGTMALVPTSAARVGQLLREAAHADEQE